MEVIKLRHVAIKQALATLAEGLRELERQEIDKSNMYKLMRDGVIQRFEYSIDTFWKFFKMYLEIVQKIAVESPAPRSILRLMLDAQLISAEELNVLLDCVAERNLTSHTYNEEMVEKIQSHISLYYSTMQVVVERVKID